MTKYKLKIENLYLKYEFLNAKLETDNKFLYLYK